MYSFKQSSKPIRSIRPTTLRSKISSMSTIETRPFWPYSYILWKEVYRNIWYMCITLVANIIWRSSHAIRSSFLLDFFFSTIVADLFSQFFTSQLGNMIVLAAKSYFQCTKTMGKENSLGAKVDYFYF